MKKWVTIWISMSSLIFMVGCSDADKYIQKHPELSTQTKKDIKNGTIRKGMRKSDVLATVGGKRPDETHTWIHNPHKEDNYLIGNRIFDDIEYIKVAWIYKEYQYEGKLKAMEDRPPGVLFGLEYQNERTGKYREVFVFFDGDIVEAVGSGEMKDPDQDFDDLIKRLGYENLR